MDASPRIERRRLPVARKDRRPALAALALLLILIGALGSALLVFRSGDRESVLVAAGDIPFGHVMKSTDFHTARAATDTGYLIDASRLAEFVGLRSTSAIPEGSLLSPRMFTTTLIPDGGEAVGIVVDADRRPSDVPTPGQVVRVYYVAGENSSSTEIPRNRVIVNAARVLSVGAGDSAGTESVTVLVSSDVAEDVTNYASSQNLALTILPDDTKPGIDTKKAGK
ncbi:MAG: hypothetical protein QM638_10415 [Nocardioides sp.]|uniref:SAF domain-containing protein n=1 Tax=Nocardioides sp. TaxID=35761 RepID=UPI0039E5A342